MSLISATLNFQGRMTFGPEPPQKIYVSLLFINSIMCSVNYCEDDDNKSRIEKILGINMR